MADQQRSLLTPSLPQLRQSDLKDSNLGQLNGILTNIWKHVIRLSGGSGIVTIPNTISANDIQIPSQTQPPSDNSSVITLGTALQLFAPGNARAAQLQGAFQTGATTVTQAQPLPPGTMLRNYTPPASSSPGTPGMITYDSGFLYICIGSNSWKKVAISSF